ncbi:MAG: zf-TFIIB domain-containing protein [Bacteroidota bacterium]
MKCPNCNVNLVMTDRSGVEIDYCPECRGVWLDRGELDKIIDRSASSATGRPAPSDPRVDHSYGDKKYDYKKKKRDSFLGDLFDF